MSLSSLVVTVVQAFPDKDEISMAYEMPIIVDEINYDETCEIVAWHLNSMALALSRVDKTSRPMQ